ncbi:MAG TPA: gamma-glutamyltransferase family protein [Thiobacillaceae bacterium]|nr:gamma-glutamyltransferase family protein [Thiobacillaceae bacterium]
MDLRFLLKSCLPACVTAALLGLAACAVAPQEGQYPYPQPPGALTAPESDSGWTEKSAAHARHWMVAAANPLAVDAGCQTLKAGGSAVDAAIAVQMVLNLVEPQSSGIGGGAFLVHWDGKVVKAFDGRETAPAGVNEALFQQDGQPMPFYAAVVGGRSVGVPGVLRMLELAHSQYGKLPWAVLFQPAIRLAEQGFAISPRLAALLKYDRYLDQDPSARAYFYNPDGSAKTAGTLLKNPELAAVFRELAERGAGAFYTAPIARDIVAKVDAHPSNPGLLSEADMAGYQARERPALCFDYRQVRVCGPPLPSSGTLALGEIFGMLEHTPIAAAKPSRNPDGSWNLSAEAVHLYSEAARLAYADRAYFAADDAFVQVPIAGLLDPAYLKERAGLIGDWSMGLAQPGHPPDSPSSRGPDRSPELPSTSQISIVDGEGHAVSMTTTIEDAFGSRQMVRGFLLNNQLTDFSFASVDGAGRPVANRVQPGKRPRSSMAPLLVFDKSDHLVMSLGSPGGSAIINYVGKVLLGTLAWGMNIQDAIDLPNFGSRNGPTELEEGRVPDALVQALQARGHEVKLMPQTSGLQGIMRVPDGWLGGADPRREGVARGD